MKLSPDEIMVLLDNVFPQVRGRYDILHMDKDETHVRLKVGAAQLRPGGTVSGPSMFGLADCAMYIAVLGAIGPEALAVTTNCSIDFMRKPEARDMIGVARILKRGRALVVGDVMLYTEGMDKPMARASLTYSIPPIKGAT
ncbi:MAG: PaaI family thioesterase [Pseudomonadota bacterium]